MGSIAASAVLDDIAITVPFANTAGDEPLASRRMISLPVESSPCNTPSRVMKNIEPSAPTAIRPRNSAPGSKVHIRTPALRVDGSGVLEAAGSNAPFAAAGEAVAVAVGNGGAHGGQVVVSDGG